MMNKTICKIFGTFILLSVLISTILLCINFIGFAILSSDSGNVFPNTARYVLEQISDNMEVSENNIVLKDTSMIDENNWCILIDENGNVIWEYNKPSDVPLHYSINDVAKMTRWFLNDYPVYVHTEDYGLLVMGMPKNAVGKYDIQYSMDWFDTLGQRILKFFLINLFLAFFFACIFGFKLYKRLKIIIDGIKQLQAEKRVNLPEKGIFKELLKSINETSESMERKNAALSARDNARLNWIAGISHDIRTPLSVITGHSESLASDCDISHENAKKAATITTQCIKIKKLIEDLNLISSLEYDMQPSKKKEVRLCPLLRKVVSEIINNGLPEKYEINVDFKYEKAVVMCDEFLMERAFFNLINNCIIHNKDGCIINISEYIKNDMVYVKISDNGSGVNNEILQNISVIPKSAHGLGLPMAYKIFYVHGGKMKVKNDNGFTVVVGLAINTTYK